MDDLLKARAKRVVDAHVDEGIISPELGQLAKQWISDGYFVPVLQGLASRCPIDELDDPPLRYSNEYDEDT